MMFLDTTFLGALFMTQDQWHAAARAWSARARPPLITTDYVLLELADGLARRDWRGTFSMIHTNLLANRDVRIVPQSTELFARGVAMYKTHTDKSWSLTDCLSFVCMRDANCTEALTSDHHFEQAGFVALLRRP